MSAVGAVPAATTSASNSMDRAVASVRSTYLRVPAFSTPPTGAITSAVAPRRRSRFHQLGDAGQVGAGVGDDADLAAGDRSGLGEQLRQRRRDGDILGGLALRCRQTESGGDLLAQVGVDVGQHLQFAFLDGLLVDLAQLEGERLDDVGLLDCGSGCGRTSSAWEKWSSNETGCARTAVPSMRRGVCT